MPETLTREAILDEAYQIGAAQPGGTLATMHAEDGTPYVTFVFFHLRPGGELLFGSGASPQHARNMLATPEVSFLIDNREVAKDDWAGFNRLVIEGRADQVLADDARYAAFLAELSAKNRMAAYFTEQGQMYLLRPRRVILMRGFAPERHVVNFT